MRILIVTSFFPPLNSIASHRPYSWAKHWSAAGHDVTVLTPYKLPDPKTDLDLPTKGFEVIETPPISWLKRLKGSYRAEDRKAMLKAQSSSQTKRSLFKRLIDGFRQKTGVFASCHMPDVTDFWVSQALHALEGKPLWDVVISTAPPFPMHRLGYRIKQKGLAKRWIMDYRDLIVDNPSTKGIFPFNLLERWLERRYVRAADRVTTVSTGLAKTLSKRYPFASIEVVENGYEPSDTSVLPEESIFTRDGKYRLVYLGSVYAGKQDPSPLFQAIRELASQEHYQPLLDRLEVLFFGPQLGNLPLLVKKHEVSRWVKLGGFVKRSEALRMQRDAHALLFLPWTDPTVDGILSGKIFEYLSSGTVIVSIGASHMEAAQKLLLEAKVGEVLLTDIGRIKKFLIQKLTHPQKMRAHADPAVLSRYTRAALAHKMLTILG